MNEQKAIDCLKNIVEYWTHRPTEVEASKLAIQALRRQIPSGVIRTSTVSQACPVCKSKVNYKFCSECGQRLMYRL